MGRGAVSWPKRAFLRLLTPSPGLAHGDFHARFPRHLWHLPRDYELAIRWLRPSFLTRDHWTPGRQCRGPRIRIQLRGARRADARAGTLARNLNSGAAFRFEVPDRIRGT